MSITDRKRLHHLLIRLGSLPDQEFLTLFRSLLNKRAFNYPDAEVLTNRYSSELILISEVRSDLLERKINSIKNK